MATGATRWVQYEVPLFVRVELDDEYEDDEVTQVVLAIPALDPGFPPPYEGIELARDHRGTCWARTAIRVPR